MNIRSFSKSQVFIRYRSYLQELLSLVLVGGLDQEADLTVFSN